MSRFTVQPSTPYNISIGQPGVAGTPTPVVSYAWSYNGTAIGTNSRFVNGYTFPSLPGTLACTITLTNIAGSVSQTVTANIAQASSVPSLSPVTIRNNAAPTVPITTIANGNAGVVLRVGGPTAADLNPVASNASGISYQWRRGPSSIAGATGQTYTLVADDEDQTVSVVVTASNPDGSVSRTSAVVVGTQSTRPPFGDHCGYLDYFNSGVTFANLMHATVAGTCGVGSASYLGRGLAGGGEALRFSAEDWSSQPEICTEDGWLTRSLTGALSSTNFARLAFAPSTSGERLSEMLQLPWSWDEPRQGYLNAAGTKVFLQNADSIYGKTFTCSLDVYWEGSGYIHPDFASASNTLTKLTPSLTTFVNDPFALGRTNVQMWKVSKTQTWTVGNTFNLGIRIEESDPNDPVRNVVALITNVRGPSGELIYAGYDQTNYTAFALYPSAKQRWDRAACMRTTQLGYAHANRSEYDNSLWTKHATDASGNALVMEMYDSASNIKEYPIWQAIVEPEKHPCGTELGLEAVCRPTHACCGRSLRAMIEICNQCDCDLWWTHPFYAITVATDIDGELTYPLTASADSSNPDASDPNETGYLRVDPDYADWFVSEIQRLKPGLKVYSEFVNEIWNTFAKFAVPNFIAYNWSHKAKADPQFGGDDQPFMKIAQSRVVGQAGVFAGTSIKKIGNQHGVFISALGTALLAKELRDRSISCELVCVIGGWHNQIGNSTDAIQSAFALQPYLMREVDAIATAPYRAALVALQRRNKEQWAIAWHDLYGSTEAAWDYIVNVAKTHEPVTNPESWWNGNGNANIHQCQAWKNVALDIAYDSDDDNKFERSLPVGWDPSKRRWNWALLGYEGGIPTYPVSKPSEVPQDIRMWAYIRVPEFNYDPRNRMHAQRYYEMLFQPWTKGITTDPQEGTAEALMYRTGRMPAGIDSVQEPMYALLNDLVNTQQFAVATGGTTIWSNQATTLHDDSPAQQGRVEVINRGVGLPNWWVGYDYGE